MKDNPKDDVKPLKKPYVKPQITRVELRPEEAVLGGCKTSSTVGLAQAFCTSPSDCFQIIS